MIIFLNMKNNCLDIYTEKGCKHCGFSEKETIKKIIGNEKVVYVTKAVETTQKDILDIVGSIAGVVTKKMLQQQKEKSYIRSTLKGYLNIPDLNIIFKGPVHFIPLDHFFSKHGEDIFQKNAVLKNMLDNGKLQLLTETQMGVLTNQHFKEEQQKQMEKDASLDDLLVDGKVEDYIEGEKEGFSDHSDAIEIEIKTAGSNRRSPSSNEGSLLPDDF